jgi:hypothetical protein
MARQTRLGFIPSVDASVGEKRKRSIGEDTSEYSVSRKTERKKAKSTEVTSKKPKIPNPEQA